MASGWYMLCIAIVLIAITSADIQVTSSQPNLVIEMENRIEKYLEKRELIHRAEIDNLYKTIQHQQNQIDKLLAREKHLETDVENLKSVAAENKPDRLQEHIARQNQRNNASTNKERQSNMVVEPNKVEVVQRLERAQSSVVVGFSAYISSPITNVGVNQDIVFDHVVTNTGNAYNSRHGVFVAPVGGLYVFSFTNIAHNANNHLNIVRNGQTQWGIFTRALESEYDTSSLTMVLQLNAADDVTVQNVDPNDTIESGMFSGFLVQESYGSVPVIGK